MIKLDILMEKAIFLTYELFMKGSQKSAMRQAKYGCE